MSLRSAPGYAALRLPAATPSGVQRRSRQQTVDRRRVMKTAKVPALRRLRSRTEVGRPILRELTYFAGIFAWIAYKFETLMM